MLLIPGIIKKNLIILFIQPLITSRRSIKVDILSSYSFALSLIGLIPINNYNFISVIT